MKRFIFIPIVTNFHLLQKAIDSVPKDLYDDYFVFNNSGGPLSIDLKQFKVLEFGGRKTFLETQNIMRQYAIDNAYDYYSFMHNDGEIQDDTCNRLVELADSQTGKWSVIFTNYDVLCAFSTECLEHIGPWGDDLWPKDQQTGYYLDNDYYMRMKLQWADSIQLPNSNVLHNEFSNTIRDATEKKRWSSQMARVQMHYIMKWGGLPGHEAP